MNYLTDYLYNNNDIFNIDFIDNKFSKNFILNNYRFKEYENNKFLLEIDLPGYDKSDIRIEVTKGNISIKDKKDKKNNSLLKSFKIADDIEVETANIKNGLLKLELERIIPETDKPKVIAIN